MSNLTSPLQTPLPEYIPSLEKGLEGTSAVAERLETHYLDSVVDIHELLAPVQEGLHQVEEKMKAVDDTLFAPLAIAFIDLIGSGGKRLRPALALMAAEFNSSLQDAPIKSAPIVSIAAAVEMLHTASLIHDDVIDGSLLRRGAPTLNASWDKGSTVIAGNYLFGHAAYFSAETGNMRVVKLFSDTINIMVNGELHQIFARHDYVQDKEGYYQRIYAKTASLFCAATKSGAILSGLPEPAIQQLYEYGYNFGMAFQIMDDILDFTGDEESLGKPAGSDIRQGTLTLPFFYFLQEQPQPECFLNKFEEKRVRALAGNNGQGDGCQWDETITQIVADVCASNAVEAARQEARHFLTLAQDNLTTLPDTIYKQSMLDLCAFVFQRTY